MNKITLRHGDWNLKPVNDIKGERIEHNSKDFVFGEGEATNHFHTLHAPAIDDMEWFKTQDGGYYVRLKNDAYATHPEHSEKVDLVVPAGTYHVYQAREKDWFSLATRRVID